MRSDPFMEQSFSTVIVRLLLIYQVSQAHIKISDLVFGMHLIDIAHYSDRDLVICTIVRDL